MEDKKYNTFSNEMHNFFDMIRVDGIETSKRKILFDIVMDLKQRTEKQKRRFILYYNLMPNENQKKLRLCEIAKIEKCSSNAVKYSVLRVANTIAILKDDRKKILLDIQNEENQ